MSISPATRNGIVLMALALMPDPVVAAAPEPIFALGEVVSTDNREPVVEQTSTVHEVTSEDIARSGAKTLDEALQLVPGLNIRNAAQGVPLIDLRGQKTRTVTLLLDGIPVSSVYDGNWNPKAIPTGMISEIKVTPGVSSELYGAGGTGGVINIITKKGTEGMHGTLGAEFATDHTRDLTTSLSGGDGAVLASVSARLLGSHGFQLSDGFLPTANQGSGLRQDSQQIERNLFGNITYTPVDNTTFSLATNLASGDYGQPAVTNYLAGDPFGKTAKYAVVSSFADSGVQLGATHAFEFPLTLRSWFYFSRHFETDNQYDNAKLSSQSQAGSLRQNTTATSTGGNVQLAYDWGRMGSTTLAVGGGSEQYDASGFQIIAVTATGQASGSGTGKGSGGGSGTTTTTTNVSSPLATSAELDKVNFALEHEIRPLDGLGLVAGIGEHLMSKSSGSSNDVYTYMVGASYDLLPQTRLHANHGRKVRFPNLSDLYAANTGNPGLKPEIAQENEIGLSQGFPDWKSSADITGFYNNAHDVIQQNNPNSISQNNTLYNYQGVEISATSRAIDRLFIKASYTYLMPRNESPGSTQKYIQYDPKNRLTMEGSYNLGWGLRVYASYLYVADQYFYTTTTPALGRPINNYRLVNARLSETIFDGGLELYLRADNLTDQNYEQSYGLPQAGRTLWFGGKASF